MRDETAVKPVIGAKCRSGGVDGVIAGLAERQHGIVSRAQLVELGLGRRAIGHRLDRGRLHPLHRGVYAVGHRLVTKEGRWMAAVLASGPGAVLSHRSAASLWVIHRSARARIEVSGLGSYRSRPGIQLHRTALPDDEKTMVLGIPVTTFPRTLLDLATVLGAHQLERAVNEAEVLRLADPLSLEEIVARYPRRAGAAAIRRILAAGQVGAARTRSELEERFLAFLRRARIARPDVNTHLQIAGRWIEADCVWREQRLVVELDGHASHSTSAAYERDRVRDRILQTEGWRVVRITWRQLHDAPHVVASDLRTLLRRGER